MLSPGEQPRETWRPVTVGRIVGLAAVALVAWQCVETYEDYLVRQKVREVLDNGAALRPEIDRAIDEKRPIETASMPPLSPHTQSMHITSDGTIVMRLKPGVSSGTTVTWKRVQLVGGHWTWDCGGDLPSNHYPDCRGRD